MTCGFNPLLSDIHFHILFEIISEQFELSVGVTSTCRIFYILLFAPAIRHLTTEKLKI